MSYERTIRRNPSAFPEEAIGEFCRMIEISLRHGSRNETLSAVDKFYDAQEAREEVTPESSVQEIGLPPRSAGILEAAGLKTVADLIQRTPGQLREYKLIGAKQVAEVRRALKRHGFKLRKGLHKAAKTPDWAVQLKATG